MQTSNWFGWEALVGVFPMNSSSTGAVQRCQGCARCRKFSSILELIVNPELLWVNKGFSLQSAVISSVSSPFPIFLLHL